MKKREISPKKQTRRAAIVLAASAVVLVQAVLVCVLFFTLGGRYTETVEILDDGTERIEMPVDGETKSLTLRRGRKTVTYYERGAKIWSLTVTGEFAYARGSACQAIDSDYAVTLYSEDAALYDEDACTAGNMAFASASVVYRDKTLLKNCALTCSLDGTLS